ncbi:YgcG family protein [Halobacteriovorax sp.]|uniref:TPM domain-containing protein n=1 Tax=Halobacteriovorax sp. TaxID=2020862 RepID=UPI0035646E9D
MLKVIKVLLFSLLITSSFAKDVPTLRPVVDQAGLLSQRAVSGLTAALVDIKKQTTNEIAILTVDSLEGESIEEYAIKVTDQWKLGQSKTDNGVLLLVSLKDRKVRIEVGQGLEGSLPDITAGRIIRAMTPYFKKNDYQSGIIVGVSQIVKFTGGELRNTPRVSGRKSNGASSILSLIIIIFIASVFGRGGRGGGVLAGLLIGSAMGGRGSSHGGGFGGSGGGGFGGGGGFSGGGASGGW